jgi:dTDP-4-amino-4,6-dideoxygalactose transaminase
MSDLHSAIGLVQVDRLNDFTEKRKANAAYFNEQITNMHVCTPQVKAGYDHVWHQYTIRVDGDRDAAVKQLTDAGVGTGIFYPYPAYRQAHLIKAGYGQISLPVTERTVHEVISLPVHPQLSQADLETIVHEVNRL